VLADSLVLRKRQLLVAAKRYGQAFDNTYEKILNKRMDY